MTQGSLSMLLQLLYSMGTSGGGAVAFAVALFIVVKLSRPSRLDAIPTVGSTSWLGSWWAGAMFVLNATKIIQEGYEKHRRAPFKVAVLHRWMVVVSSHEHLEELSRASEDQLSFGEALKDNFQAEYTMGHEVHHNQYHVSIVRSQLTRNIGALYPGMRDELMTAFDDILDLKGNEWKSVPASRSIQEVVFRTSNRAFLGLPLCRNPDWIGLNLKFTRCIIDRTLIIWLFPIFLKSLAVRLFTEIGQIRERGRKLLGPIIEERQRWINEYGNEWADKPNDLLSWLIEEAEGPHSTVAVLTERMLVCNFAAIHSTSMAFTNALLYLAENPQCIQLLREEVEAIVAKEGWTKVALNKMGKMDSFLRESERMHSVATVGLQRKTLTDYTFSDGTFVPKGTMIIAASRCVHYDEELYPNARVFEPFRFADPHEGEVHQLVSTTAEYLTFGHGRHACPGRFFAAIELKSMLAHVLVAYDIKFEDGVTSSQRLHTGPLIVPDPKARVMFRRRII